MPNLAPILYQTQILSFVYKYQNKLFEFSCQPLESHLSETTKTNILDLEN